MKKTTLATFGAVLLAAVPALAASANATTTASVTVAASASVSVSGTTTLSYTGTFPTGTYDGQSTVTFSCRTTKVGGTGSITLSAQAATWTAAGGGSGPAVADLTYSSAAGTYTGAGSYVATATVQNGVETNVVTGLGSNNRTSSKTVLANFVLNENVSWETDTYTVPVRFTISAL